MHQLKPLLFLFITIILISSACDDDNSSNVSIDIPPPDPNSVTFTFDGQQLVFNDDEVDGAALVNGSNQVEKLVITAERTPDNRDGHALCIEINDTDVQPDTYAARSDSANGAARMLLIELVAEGPEINVFTPTGNGSVNLEILSQTATSGNFTSNFESDGQTVTDVTGAFNVDIKRSESFEDVGNCTF